MRIIELKAENFKRLKAINIRPGERVQQITGRNAQGKTSVLDAVWAALGGKAAAPERPIRDGEKKAMVSLDLGKILVTRKWSADDKSVLTVESKDGASYKSPQAMLDELVGGLSFDPLAFTRGSAKEQAATLRAIAGLDTAKLEGQRKKVYDERTEANRALKAEQARLDLLPILDGPDEPVSVASLLAELEAAERQKIANDDQRSHHRRVQENLQTVRAGIVAIERQLADLREQEAELARAELAHAERSLAQVEPDFAAIKQRIGAAEEVNAVVRHRAARAKQVAVVRDAGAVVAGYTANLSAFDEEKAKLLAAAVFPVPGLSVDGDTPTFNGIPLAQASGAEQLRVSLAVAEALNPQLKVVLVRDGSLLDADGLRMVAEWAEAKDMQVLLERVADLGQGVGVVIEDGMVADEFVGAGAA